MPCGTLYRMQLGDALGVRMLITRRLFLHNHKQAPASHRRIVERNFLAGKEARVCNPPFLQVLYDRYLMRFSPYRDLELAIVQCAPLPVASVKSLY